jgi:hypothetical protein
MFPESILRKRYLGELGATPTEEEVAKAQRLYDWWENRSKYFGLFKVGGNPFWFRDLLYTLNPSEFPWARPSEENVVLFDPDYQTIAPIADSYERNLKIAYGDIQKQIPILREFIRTRSPSAKKELEISNAWIIEDIKRAKSDEDRLFNYIPYIAGAYANVLFGYISRIPDWDFNPSRLEEVIPTPVQPQEVQIIVLPSSSISEYGKEVSAVQVQTVQTTPSPVTSVAPQPSAPAVEISEAPAVPEEIEEVKPPIIAGLPNWSLLLIAGIGALFLFKGGKVDERGIYKRTKKHRKR